MIYQKLSVLKHKCILLQFWRSKVQNEFWGAKIKMSVGLILFGGSREDLGFGACDTPWLLALFA